MTFLFIRSHCRVRVRLGRKKRPCANANFLFSFFLSCTAEADLEHDDLKKRDSVARPIDIPSTFSFVSLLDVVLLLSNKEKLFRSMKGLERSIDWEDPVRPNLFNLSTDEGADISTSFTSLMDWSSSSGCSALIRISYKRIEIPGQTNRNSSFGFNGSVILLLLWKAGLIGEVFLFRATRTVPFSPA